MQLSLQHLNAAKTVVVMVVNGCTSYTVHQVIKSNVVTETKMAKYAVKIGSFAIGGLIVNAVEPRAEQRFDDVFAKVKKRLEDKVEKAEDAPEEETPEAPTEA